MNVDMALRGWPERQQAGPSGCELCQGSCPGPQWLEPPWGQDRLVQTCARSIGLPAVRHRRKLH